MRVIQWVDLRLVFIQVEARGSRGDRRWFLLTDACRFDIYAASSVILIHPMWYWLLSGQRLHLASWRIVFVINQGFSKDSANQL